MILRVGLALVLPLLASLGCRAATPVATPDAETQPGSFLVLDGERVPIDTVVLPWFEAPHYNGYATEARFGGEETGLRYAPGRDVAGREGLETIELFVLHYDAVGTSRGCFRVLHDQRGLSVHFLLDVDGTIYQTLDVTETAWHARHANPRSIGIEIANKGAYPPGGADVLDAWYQSDAGATTLTIPDEFGAAGVREAGAFRPARAEPVEGTINGHALVQYDFTTEQYEALVRLTTVLCRELPGLVPDVPRDGDGQVDLGAMTKEELAEFRGIIAHSHVTTEKVDPGPAFDWESFLADVRQRLARP